MDKNFNLIVNGVGGQGVITLLSLIDAAAFIEGYDVRSSELHGLSQRGGSVLTHIIFGKKVHSPLVERGQADLVISMEMLEGLRTLNFTNKNTAVLVNKYSSPILGGLSQEEITKKLNEVFSKNLHLIEASEICKEKLQNEVVNGIYLLGYAVSKNLIPLSKQSVVKAIEENVPEKYKELNIKAFNLAFND